MIVKDKDGAEIRPRDYVTFRGEPHRVLSLWLGDDGTNISLNEHQTLGVLRVSSKDVVLIPPKEDA